MTPEQFIESAGHQNHNFMVGFNITMESQEEDFRMYPTNEETGEPDYTGEEAALAFIGFSQEQKDIVIPLSGIGGKRPC